MTAEIRTEHTPGPWFANQHHGLSEWIIGPGKCHHIATITCGEDRPEAEANARLIAAAPDLLKACKAAGYHWEDTDAVTGKALRDAIAKAEDHS